MKIKYTKNNIPGYIRLFRVSDLDSLGVTHDDVVRFTQSNDWTLDLPEPVARALAEALPDEFELDEPGEQENGTPDESSDQSSQQLTLGVPDASQANPADLVDDSGDSKPKNRSRAQGG